MPRPATGVRARVWLVPAAMNRLGLVATLGIFVDDALQRLNACKNVLALTVNAVASVVFVLTTEIDWAVVAVIAVGSTIGGQIGATFGRRLDPRALRALIVCVGSIALVRLVTR